MWVVNAIPKPCLASEVGTSQLTSQEVNHINNIFMYLQAIKKICFADDVVKKGWHCV